MLINNFYVMIIIFFYMIIFFNLQFVLVKYFFMLVEFAHPIFSGDVCAEFASGEFVHKCARENLRGNCARILCAEFVCRFVRGSFARSVRRENVRRTFARSVRREIFFFGDVRGSFFFRRCARDVFGDGRGNSGPKMGAGGAGGGQKGPKRAKNAQNGPKWPKMAKKGGVPKKGPKWHILSPSGTRVVRGPLRLIAQGGKSRQNMH